MKSLILIIYLIIKTNFHFTKIYFFFAPFLDSFESSIFFFLSYSKPNFWHQKKIFDMTSLFDGKYLWFAKPFYHKILSRQLADARGTLLNFQQALKNATKCTFFGFLWEQYIFLLVILKKKFLTWPPTPSIYFYHKILSRQLADARGAVLNFQQSLKNAPKCTFFGFLWELYIFLLVILKTKFLKNWLSKKNFWHDLPIWWQIFMNWQAFLS